MSSHIFYEVRDFSGAIWGGENAKECYEFFTRNEPPLTVWVSEWEGEGEDLYQTSKAIDITPLVHATRMSAMNEVKRWVLRSV